MKTQAYHLEGGARRDRHKSFQITVSAEPKTMARRFVPLLVELRRRFQNSRDYHGLFEPVELFGQQQK